MAAQKQLKIYVFRQSVSCEIIRRNYRYKCFGYYWRLTTWKTSVEFLCPAGSNCFTHLGRVRVNVVSTTVPQGFSTDVFVNTGADQFEVSPGRSLSLFSGVWISTILCVSEDNILCQEDGFFHLEEMTWSSCLCLLPMFLYTSQRGGGSQAVQRTLGISLFVH